MSRFLARTRRWIAPLVVAAMLFPVGRWAADEFAFGASGEAVEEQLGDEAAMTDAMFLVRSVDCAGRVSTGSAFVLRVDGQPTVLTNRHVVEDARSVSIRPLDGGSVVFVDGHSTAESADVAVLFVDAAELSRELPPGGMVERGDEVRTIGFPSGRPALETGEVAERSADRLLLDLAVSGGASGSPVIDAEGKVLGQVFATTADGHGVASPIDRVIAALDTLTEAAGCSGP